MTIAKNQNKTLAWVLLIILTLIWGTSFILIKRSLLSFSAAEVGALRMFTAGIVLLPIAIRNFKKVQGKNWGSLFIIGFLGSFIPAFLFAKAETNLDSSLAGVLNALTPIFVLIMGALLFAQKFSKSQVIGIIIGFLGTSFLVFAGSYGSLSTLNLYGLFVVLATICYGLNANVIKYRVVGLSALTITSISLGMVTPIACIYLVFFSDVVQQVLQEPEARVSLIYVSVLGVMSTAIAMGLFNKLIQITNPIFTSSVTYLIPIVAVFWGLWDGEILLVGHYLGMSGILIGVYIANQKKF
ncbi:MAG: DMT family transporter [Cyclobacteriaceae bacterium]|nr:DMT family transporter [Cyclobacteriaceae bacterium]